MTYRCECGTCQYKHRAEEAEKELTEVKARERRIIGSLHQFGMHHPLCAADVDTETPCSCGYADAFREAMQVIRAAPKET